MLERIRNFFKERQLSILGATLWILGAALVLSLCAGVLTLPGSGEFPVEITEILASNASLPNADGYCCDYIELHNRADYPVDLTGFQLGTIAGSSRYVFPAETILAPGAYLTVYCSREIPNCAPFEISRAGEEEFCLIGTNGAVIDSVTTLACGPDQPMVLLAGQWTLSDTATPGYENTAPAKQQDIYNSGVSPVRITELSAAGNYYADGRFCDWVELYNTGDAPVDISGFTLSDTVNNDKYTFPAGSVLEAGAYLVLPCADNFTGFALSGTTEEQLVLKTGDGRIVELIQTAPVDAGSLSLCQGTWEAVDIPTPGFENSLKGQTDYLAYTGATAGTVRISEIMAAGQLVLPDEDGEFPDWVELHNTGDKPVSLEGWSLSDDPEIPRKWCFPQVTIGPGERLTVFCSGKDRTADTLHTDFSLAASGEHLILTASIGIPVDSVTFPAGKANRAFTFDDDSAAITDMPTPGYANNSAGYDTLLDGHVPLGPLAIWEVMTSNDKYLPQQLGECYDWVELRNISDIPLDLGQYFITDDPDVPKQHPLPEITLAPGAYIAVILSGDTSFSTSRYDHAGFSLDALEDQLLVYGPEETLMDYVYLKDIPVGCSYGRSESGGFTYMTPTPLKQNEIGQRHISACPVSDYAPGVHITQSAVTLTLDGPGKIYYTTDGSVPDEHSNVYKEPLTVDKTTVVRAVSVEPEKRVSDIYTATFVVNEDHSLPVVSLVTDPDGLWGPDGVYRNGDISVKEIRLPANLAYAGPDGSFSINCQTNLHGVTTVLAFSKKSFTLRFPDQYDGALEYDVFEDGEATVFRSLLLRTAHEVMSSSQMRDTLMSHAASQGSEQVICQKYKYVVLYLNGDYWGIYALREHHSTEHYATYMDVPADTVEMVRYMDDAVNSLSAFYTFCRTHSLALDENYAYAKTVLDMESFADWMIYQAYACNVDIYENMRYYYSPEDGLWRCGLSDMDLGMPGIYAAFDELARTFHHSRAINALMANKAFQDLLATRLAKLLAGPLSDANMIATLETMEQQLKPEVARDAERWGEPSYGWQNEVDYLKRFCDGRSKQMIDSLCSQLGFSKAQREYYFGNLLAAQ